MSYTAGPTYKLRRPFMTYLTHSIDCISLMLVNWFYFFHVSRRNGNCNVSNTRAIILVDCRNNLYNHFYSVAQIILFVYIAIWKFNYKNLTILMGLIWNSADIIFYKRGISSPGNDFFYLHCCDLKLSVF